MFDEVLAAIEEYNEAEGPLGVKELLRKFVRKVQEVQRLHGNRYAVDMLDSFRVGFHSHGGILGSNLMLIELKLDWIRLQLGGERR